MSPAILHFKDLQQICQPGKQPRLATVELWARKNGIAYKYDARGGIWTTLDAINAALGLQLPDRPGERAAYPEDLI